jgi:outer membrane protein TolC
LEFINVIDAQRELLNLQLERVDALKQREISLAELSLIIEGATPGQTPILWRNCENSLTRLGSRSS